MRSPLLPKYSRPDLVVRVLAHGAMSVADLEDCCRWPGRRVVERALRQLLKSREVRRVHLQGVRHRYGYELTDLARVPRYDQ